MNTHDRYGKRTGDDRPVETLSDAEIQAILAGTRKAKAAAPGAFGRVLGTQRPRPARDSSNRAAQLKHARMMRATARRARGPT